MALFWAFSKRARLFFARKMETVDAMVPWDDEAQDQRGAQPATLQAAEMQRPGKAA